MAEFRRLRTQDERGPEAWRAAAESRPGFATWPETAPGSPSWWRRGDDDRPLFRVVESDAVPPDTFIVGDFGEFARAEREGRPVNPRAFVMGRVDPPEDPGPAPVDGETCKQWCGYCHLGSEPEPIAEAATAVGNVLSEQLPAIGEALAEIPPPRRRWWHRYTRRNP